MSDSQLQDVLADLESKGAQAKPDVLSRKKIYNFEDAASYLGIDTYAVKDFFEQGHFHWWISTRDDVWAIPESSGEYDELQYISVEDMSPNELEATLIPEGTLLKIVKAYFVWDARDYENGYERDHSVFEYKGTKHRIVQQFNQIIHRKGVECQYYFSSANKYTNWCSDRKFYSHHKPFLLPEELDKLVVSKSLLNNSSTENSAAVVNEGVACGVTIEEAWLQFESDKLNARDRAWNQKTHDDNRRYYELLISGYGKETPLSKVDHVGLNEIVDNSLFMPKRNLKDYRDLTVTECYELALDRSVPEEHLVGVNAAREFIKFLQAFLSAYCTNKKGYFNESPTKRIQKKQFKKKVQEYACLDTAQLKEILLSANELPDEKKYCFIIAVFSGMRTSEITRLKKQDIVVDDETSIRFFKIYDGKTAASTRKVPLHQSIIDSGFLDYVNSSEENELFPVLSKPKSKVVTNTFKRIWEKLDNPKENSEKQKYSFYSLRSTFATKVLSQNVTPALLSIVLGHAVDGSMGNETATYVKTGYIPLAQLKSVVDAFQIN